jgi:phosphomannomutase
MSELVGEVMQRAGVAFGTSGARGLEEAFSDDTCEAIVGGFLRCLRERGELGGGSAVGVGGDLRASTPRIAGSVVRAVRAAGHEPVWLGHVPTPALAAWGFARRLPTVMVTGSHIPEDRNGLKLARPACELMKADERALLSIPHVRSGLAPSKPMDGQAACEAADEYRARYLLGVGGAGGAARPLAGARVGVYEHSSVARDLVAEVLHALGAAVTRLGRSERFVSVDTEAIRPEDHELARAWAASGRFDALVSTDGDGDRPLVSDEHGAWLRGDVVGLLTAAWLGARSVVTPVTSTSAIERSGLFERVSRTRIGSPHVLARMEELIAAGAPGPIVGFEANGGVLLGGPVNRPGQTFASLPTRDALVAHLALLVQAASKGSMRALVGSLPARATASDRRQGVPPEASARFVSEVLAAGQGALSERWGATLGAIESVDATDGARLTLATDEVVHFRASGNAPELRCYVEAATSERAHALLQAGMTILYNGS